MSLVDQAGHEAQELRDRLRRSTGQVPWWGFTGPPGVGKSTLIDALLSKLREGGRRIGVVAVDPTSPLSDGALLGDRVRMMRHAVDRDVFIRSLATRRREGGLSDATLHCARLLELAGYDPVLIETVGVGQNEVDIAAVADICVVVLGPGYGDDIQLTKAGLLEIADIVVVNKCDLPDATRLLNEVREEIGGAARFHAMNSPSNTSRPDPADPDSSRKHAPPAPDVEILGIEAKSGRGVDELLEKLLEVDRAARDPQQRQHYRHQRVLGEIKRSATLLYEQALERALATPTAKDLVARLEQGELSLNEVVSYQLSVLSEEGIANPRPRRDSGEPETDD
jgi:LAO/AO transport system kinase